MMICKECRKRMEEFNFYSYKDGHKAELCKKCLTKNINDYEEDTFLWLLKEFDIPYIKEKWKWLRDKNKANYRLVPTIFGRYLSIMKLYSFKECSWDDTDSLNSLPAFSKEVDSV